MTWKERLQTTWNNRHQIAEGFYNTYIASSEEIKQEAKRRMEICRTNQCGLYNPEGIDDNKLKAIIPGSESCGGCGCVLEAKAHCMSCRCHLGDVEQMPLWDRVLTKEQEDFATNKHVSD